jgi:transposase
VPISGVNAKRVAFGVINAQTGTRLFLDQKNHRQESFHAFLDLVHLHYRSRQVAMVLDEERGHTAKASQALARRLDIELLWLPKRSPHLNPMDHLWRHGKENICANWQYADIDDEVESFFVYLHSLTPTEAFRAIASKRLSIIGCSVVRDKWAANDSPCVGLFHGGELSCPSPWSPRC